MQTSSTFVEPSRIDVSGHIVSVHDSGEGPALLLIHGGAPGATGWANFGHNVPAFAKHFRTLVVDLPGTGGSDWIDAPEGRVRAQAELYAGLLAELGVDKAHVVGLGSGGAIAMRMALDFPAVVQRLVLVSAAGSISTFEAAPTPGLRALGGYYRGTGPSSEKMRNYIEYSVHDQSLVTEALVEERYQESVRPETLEAATRRAAPHPSDDVWKEADRIAAPTLVVWGKENQLKAYDHGLLLARLIPNSEFHLYARTGLSVQIERARKFERLVIEFLSTTD